MRVEDLANPQRASFEAVDSPRRIFLVFETNIPFQMDRHFLFILNDEC